MSDEETSKTDALPETDAATGAGGSGDAIAPPAPAPEPTPEAPANPWYTVGEWSGMPNYCCTQCPFATLDVDLMDEHSFKRHWQRTDIEPEFGPDGLLVSEPELF